MNIEDRETKVVLIASVISFPIILGLMHFIPDFIDVYGSKLTAIVFILSMSGVYIGIIVLMDLLYPESKTTIGEKS